MCVCARCHFLTGRFCRGWYFIGNDVVRSSLGREFSFRERMIEENGILGSFCHIVYKNCIRLESVESKTFVRVRIFRNVEV